jgi:flagellar hook-associated protein 3 FlgL
MRVSTSQFYLQSAQQMSSKTSDVNEQMAYLTSGKRVLTAKDDAVSYGTLAGLNDSLANIEKYKRNITQAESHIGLQDIIFADAENILNNIKDQMLQANNGVYTSEDLAVIAKEARNNFNHLIDLANSQDENSVYIFSGFQTEKQPFSQQSDGSVIYSGDTGIQELQVARNIKISTNQSGDAAFMKVDNAIGDFSVSYPVTSTTASTSANTSGVAVASANVVNRNTYNTSVGPFTFTTDSNNYLTVTDSDTPPVVVFPILPAIPSPYVPGQTISVEGIDVTLSGNPLPDESFTLNEQADISIFATINSAIAWMEQGTTSTNTEQHQVNYNTILEQLTTGTSHITARRVDAGIRLQALDNQESRHLDSQLNLSIGKSTIEDLDFAKAISEFEQSKIALQASQQAFSKVQGLTLFNYI